MSELPGRVCPVRYHYGASAIARAPAREARVLYVVGGLYGNLEALDAIAGLMAREREPVSLCFNGDFNWFNVAAADFAEINERVLKHHAVAGNVEAELVSGDLDAGCGCAYPESVADGVVERSNQIFARLLGTAQAQPGILARLGDLPMYARFRIGDTDIGVVHGDHNALAGWDFDVSALADPSQTANQRKAFDAAGVSVFASTHTCLPALKTFGNGSTAQAIINNGSAGMPNFAGGHFGVITRMATEAAAGGVLYGTRMGDLHVEAIRLDFDQEAWTRRFLSQWPPGSTAHESYFERIARGPAFDLKQARLFA